MLYLLEETQGKIWGQVRVNVYNNKYFLNCFGDKRSLSNNYKDVYMYINVNV